ncbi:hypothetical protein HJC23_010598 [Cyclotella cryptica]|uniref:RNA methyltransferase n=1 Tax=Cyclotella cryptica TaxID=29204 RepID=A0ABD3PPG1_9STRA
MSGGGCVVPCHFLIVRWLPQLWLFLPAFAASSRMRFRDYDRLRHFWIGGGQSGPHLALTPMENDWHVKSRRYLPGGTIAADRRIRIVPVNRSINSDQPIHQNHRHHPIPSHHITSQQPPSTLLHCIRPLSVRQFLYNFAPIDKSSMMKRRRQEDGGNASSHRRHKNTHRSHPKSQHDNSGTHRFGRVMHQPPKLKLQPRSASAVYPTVSIAIPGSVVSNAQTRELQTQLAGQIARAAAVYRIDEIVVFDDGLGSTLKTVSNYRRGPNLPRKRELDDPKRPLENEETSPDKPEPRSVHEQPSTDPHAFLARILQYCECPQYLRRKFFPMHPDLQFAGLLPPLDAPHHLRRNDVSAYREGVVLERRDGEDGADGSLVDCGIPNRLVQVDRVIPPGIRCTVKIDPKSYPPPHSSKKGIMKGNVVSPTSPRDEAGIYWGYTTRLASSIGAIFDECPYEGGYDVKVGTSERGDVSIDDAGFCLRKKQPSGETKHHESDNDDSNDSRFDHLLIVFGGVAGIEESVDADESMTLSGEDSKKMFDVWLNICPYQGSRTIRTEEAVLITLSRLSPFIAKNASSIASPSKMEVKSNKKERKITITEDVVFSDAAVSDESSEEEEEDEEEEE